MKFPSYYKKVYQRKNLYKAWRKVYENGIKSASSETNKEVIEYNKNADTTIKHISSQLKDKKFKFLPSKGIPVKRAGKKPRPIVSAPVSNKIVQRSILNVLQSHSKIQKYISVPTSFGGLKDTGVKNAIEIAYKSILCGSKWYLRTDIETFFAAIPRKKVLSRISSFISDSDFNDLLSHAVETELSNLEILGEHKDLFPTEEIGVAQGCCLSPLIGNILLHDFDKQINGRGIVCLRYIDDILILGRKPVNVKAAFDNAKNILNDLGLLVYDPFKDTDKAKLGKVDDGIEFLGCEILPDVIRPSKKSQKKLLKKIELVFKDSSNLMSSPEKLSRSEKSIIDTLKYVSNIVKGWGSQYSFCNDKNVIGYLDKEICSMIKDYITRFAQAKRKLNHGSQKDIRRLIGVHLLSDSNHVPIIEQIRGASPIFPSATN